VGSIFVDELDSLRTFYTSVSDPDILRSQLPGCSSNVSLQFLVWKYPLLGSVMVSIASRKVCVYYDPHVIPTCSPVDVYYMSTSCLDGRSSVRYVCIITIYPPLAM
jgi:hypothetical protein